MKFDNQLRYAVNIVSAYKGETPLHAWLKNFFREHKQMGSRDRKLVSNMVYGFYRLGHAVKSIPAEDRILVGLFLCNEAPNELLQYFRPEWNAKVGFPLEKKIAVYQGPNPDFEPTDIFPWPDELSAGIDHQALCLSFLRQPDLFLRIRPGQEQTVRAKFNDPLATPSAIPHEFIPPFTLRLPNGFKVEDYFTPDHEVVVQDINSQRISTFFPSNPPLRFWDACAASGGKSILAHDLYPQMDITVSDIRKSILRNLCNRFQQAGIKKYHAFVADLTQAPAPDTQTLPPDTRPGRFDLVLVDAPCTGSGTWSRTPEELFFFDPRKIAHYTAIQTKILGHITHDLTPGACLVYSTCSVFKKENEEIAAFLRQNFGLEQDLLENITGYNQRADSLFAARFRAPRR